MKQNGEATLTWKAKYPTTQHFLMLRFRILTFPASPVSSPQTPVPKPAAPTHSSGPISLGTRTAVHGAAAVAFRHLY